MVGGDNGGEAVLLCGAPIEGQSFPAGGHFKGFATKAVNGDALGMERNLVLVGKLRDEGLIGIGCPPA